MQSGEKLSNLNDTELAEQKWNMLKETIAKWKEAFKSKGHRISRTKMKYMKSNHSKIMRSNEFIVHIDGQEKSMTSHSLLRINHSSWCWGQRGCGSLINANK